jgi:regulation of enolase protein 1 (concanavalin A-like superfamily)
MKRILLFIIVTIFNPGSLQSQEIKISSIPYLMHFENEVLDYKIINDNHLKIVAPANTDLFITPDGSYATNKSPRLLFKPYSNFILTSKIKLEFNSKWDAGVLLIYNDSKHFAKFCFENDFKGQPRIVSVVCNDVADDCNSMAISSNEIFYRIIGSAKNNTFGFYYSEDGKEWFPIRGFRLNKTDNLQIGFSAQSPTGKECSVEFIDINFQERKPNDYWKGD